MMRILVCGAMACLLACGGEGGQEEDRCDVSGATGLYHLSFSLRSGNCGQQANTLARLSSMTPAVSPDCEVSSSEVDTLECSSVYGFVCPVGQTQVGSYVLALDMLDNDGDVITGVQYQEIYNSYDGSLFCAGDYKATFTRQ